jgi:YesN/AraC family two-component response regulator
VAVRAGMDDFLSKPVDIHQLSAVLAKWSPKADLQAAGETAEALDTESPVTGFDAEALLQRLMGDKELAQLIINSFLVDFPIQWTALQQRLTEADQPGARFCYRRVGHLLADGSDGGRWQTGSLR